MYQVAVATWDDVIPSEFEAFSKGYNGLKVAYGSLAEPDSRHQLQNKHLVLGFLQLMDKLAERSVFCTARATLYLHNQLIGQLAMGRPLPTASVGVDGVNLALGGGGAPVGNRTVARSLGDEKEIVDPEDSDFVIQYEVYGEAIPCQTLFSAALNGLAKSAAYYNDEPCEDYAGVSTKEELTYVVNSRRGMASYLLTFHFIKIMFKLLPAHLYDEGTCGEVKFSFVFRGERLGGGSIVLSDFQKRERLAVRQ